MNNRQKSIEAGLDPNWLAYCKHTNPDQYEWISRHSIQEYRNRSNLARNRLGDIYYALREKGLISQFWRDCLQDLVSSKWAFYRMLDSVAFRRSESMTPYKALLKWEEVVRRYEKFDKDNKLKT